MVRVRKAKIALVTGASRGIGRAIACSLGLAGFSIIVNYFNSEKDAKKTQNLLTEIGTESLLYKADVTNRKEVREMAISAFNWGGRIDVLVNNAGFLEQKDFYLLTDEDWNATLAANLGSAFICTQEVSKYMKEFSSITNISSIGGQIGGPNAPHYSAAKGALITFTKSTAKLLASKNIRVNAVAPGFISTDMFSHILKVQNKKEQDIASTIPLNRIGLPSDIGNVVDFLSSEKASYITGQVINVNGGSLI